MNEQSNQQADRLIRAARESGYPHIAAALRREAIQTALSVSGRHAEHPLVGLLTSIGEEFGHDRNLLVLQNIERGLQASNHDQDAWSWSGRTLNDACEKANFGEASSKLGELRAFGALWEAEFSATPVPTADIPTPDFRVEFGSEEFAVEVHSKQISADAIHPMGSGATSVSPAGCAKPNECTAQNVASKFASIKSGAAQANEGIPTILWLDVQSPVWVSAGVGASFVEPVTMSDGLVFSGGLWHAIYGSNGTPVFEQDLVYQMEHDGLFTLSPAWAGAVISLPDSNILFENALPANPLTDHIRARIIRLPRFDLARSRMNLSAGGLNESLELDSMLLQRIALLLG